MVLTIDLSQETGTMRACGKGLSFHFVFANRLCPNITVRRFRECVLNKQFYESSSSPVVILDASRPVLLPCHSRIAQNPRLSAGPCSIRGDSCHLPFAHQHRTLAPRRRSAPPTSVAIRFWLVRVLRLVGARSPLFVLYPRLARHHSAWLVCIVVSRSRPLQ